MTPRRAATLKDVAELAGVSKVAVSVVLNGARSNVGVSPATRQRILDTAASLQYRPNAVARSLRLRATNVIGFYSGADYAPARGGDFLSQILAGLQDGCEDHGRDLLVHGTFRGQSVDDIYRELASGKIDGLVLHAPGNDALVEQLQQASLPCVLIASPVESLASVVVDDAGGMRKIAEHLAEKGHRRVAFRHSILRHVSARRRADAFLAACEEFGMEAIVTSPSHGDNRLSAEEETLLTLPRDQRPTAFACWNDTTAYPLLRHALHHGLRVPDDIAITGFNGFAIAGIPRWTLTTIVAPWREVARTAVRRLVTHLNGDEATHETCLPVAFRAGDTT